MIEINQLKNGDIFYKYQLGYVYKLKFLNVFWWYFDNKIIKAKCVNNCNSLYKENKIIEFGANELEECFFSAIEARRYKVSKKQTLKQKQTEFKNVMKSIGIDNIYCETTYSLLNKIAKKYKTIK